MRTFALPDIRVRELLAVLALAEYGSFVAAAAYLQTSQPALTQALKRLERHLGVVLFARSTRRVEITPAGREFVALAERVLNDLQIAVRSMGDVAGEQRGQVIISTYSAFASRPLAGLVRRYRETRPEVEVRIREGRQPDILEDVRSGVADVGIGYVNTLPETLESTTLRREPLCAVLPAGHRLARAGASRVRLSELRGTNVVSLPPDSYTRRLIEGATATAGFHLRVGLVVTRFESVVQYAAAGNGIGVVPAGALPPKPWRGFHAAPLAAPAMSVTVGLITLRGRHPTPAAASLMALVRASTPRRRVSAR